MSPGSRLVVRSPWRGISSTGWWPKSANGKHGADLSRLRDTLDRAILDGLKLAHDAATSIDAHGPVSNQTALVRVHGGTILDPGDVVVGG